MTPPCPNPHKARYATVQAANRRCTITELRIGTTVYPYECICGYWHLTKNPTAHLPTWRQPKADEIHRLQHLPAHDFTRIVRADIDSRNPTAERLALRHPHLLTRWRWTLRTLLTDVNRQLTERAHDPYYAHDWQHRAERFRDAVRLRLTECQRLRTQTGTRAA